MHVFNNFTVYAVGTGTFLAVEISYDFVYFVFIKVCLWLGVWGPLFVV